MKKKLKLFKRLETLKKKDILKDKYHSVLIEQEILKIPALSAQYQIHVNKDHNLDELEVWVEPRIEVTSKKSQELKIILEENIKAWTGVRAKVSVVAPASIERSIGKAIRVIDKRKTKKG